MFILIMKNNINRKIMCVVLIGDILLAILLNSPYEAGFGFILGGIACLF